MDEKKLTDEEIVKALDKTKQELANISQEDDDYDKLLTVKTIVDYCHDLIHRLKNENDRLNDMKFTQEHCDLYKENEWLKAEIKRELADHEEFTKKANEEIERWKIQVVQGLRDMKLEVGIRDKEIERLTEENKHLDKLLREKRLDELNVAKQIVAQNCSLNEENSELQKQVDELKGKVKDQQKEVRMARGFCIHEKRRTESAKALATCKNKIGLAEQKRQYKRGYDKAVKDTAKEILQMADKINTGGQNDLCELEVAIKERYGVEVAE